MCMCSTDTSTAADGGHCEQGQEGSGTEPEDPGQ